MSYQPYYSYPNRTLCDVLRDMRALYESRNFSALLGLIEEAQIFGNKMEAALGDKNDIASRTEKRAELKKEIRELEKIKKALENTGSAGGTP